MMNFSDARIFLIVYLCTLKCVLIGFLFTAVTVYKICRSIQYLFGAIIPHLPYFLICKIVINCTPLYCKISKTFKYSVIKEKASCSIWEAKMKHHSILTRMCSKLHEPRAYGKIVWLAGLHFSLFFSFFIQGSRNRAVVICELLIVNESYFCVLTLLWIRLFDN